MATFNDMVDEVRSSLAGYTMRQDRITYLNTAITTTDLGLDADRLAPIRGALQTGTPLGNEKFKSEIEAVLQRKVGHARRGRPKKT